MTLLYEMMAAFLGTVAFSILFHVPPRQCCICGVVGGIGWFVYAWGDQLWSATVGCFLASVFVVCCSRVLAVFRKVPSNVFLLSGLFPIIPGVGIYNTIFHLMTGDWMTGVTIGLNMLEQMGAMVLGIIIVFTIPNRVFVKIGVTYEKIRKK